ncbi:hypothetical protein LOD99_14103 [Oopsacas minuta]|uniref:Coiled-coil domain-containing protein 13 n=1 Tax=Oopsacas minuta TaxID=111878 RepID=A0AAV7KIX7_9METZ|nr:hypothetical protein LOD99_14103 [Oopsacas minuta]
MSVSPESDQASHSLRLRERLMAIQQNRQTGRIATQSNTDPVSDDNLKLQTFSVKSCSEVNTAISEKELCYYQDQVARLQTENSQLKKGIGEKDRDLKKSQEALQAIGAGGGGGNVAAKIVELSKKVRELQSELYTEQSRSMKLERNQIELQELIRLGEGELDQLRDQLENKSPSLEELSPSDQKKLELMREEVTDLKARLMEGKNLNQSMKQELRLTQKALTQELGPDADKYTLSQLINSEAAWKGRAQQIKLLKKKVSELRAQLQQDTVSTNSQLDTERDVSSAERLDTCDMRVSTRLYGSSVSSQSDRQRELLKKMETSRKETAEKTQNELDELRKIQTDYKHKNTALQARNQTLSQEVKQLRRDLADSKSREISLAKQSADTATTSVNKNQANIEGLKQELHKKCVQIENLTQEISNNKDHVTLPSLGESIKSSKVRQVVSKPGVSLNRGHLTDNELLDIARINGMLLSVSVERDKLRELVSLMQERLQEAVEIGSTQETLLRQMKHSNALLEKEACRGGNRSGAVLTSDNDSLMQRINISEDENSALQHRLASINQSRKEDTRMYKEMLDTSRQIFTDTLNQLRSVVVDRESV